MKRVLDVIISILMLVFLTPIALVVALLIRINMGAPVLFKQKRPGLYGKPFNLYKFRTMIDADVEIADQYRLTSLGALLRKYSLDEIPQLINVLKGDMSLVGPRPLLMEYLPLYSTGQERRHDVRPGITGWAQVNGRNALTWAEKFKLDLWYVDNQTILLDWKILVYTVVKVFKREGINHQGTASMEKFKGTNEGI